jgi:hypothetical protein
VSDWLLVLVNLLTTKLLAPEWSAIGFGVTYHTGLDMVWVQNVRTMPGRIHPTINYIVGIALTHSNVLGNANAMRH